MNIIYTLDIHSQSHTYPIYIGDGGDVPDLATQIMPFIRARQVLIVSNDTVAPLYLSELKSRLTLQGLSVAECVLADGEQYKNQDSINAIYDVLMTHHFARDCTLIALGGGVVGDMTGFAAASYMRGVDFIQIPTTLLAQVDSSVGGKTGINHALGKNMIGAFWQPKCVLADMATFKTLPKREFSAGMAEVIKYALIFDADFLTWLEMHHQEIMAKDSELLSYMVYRSCDYKAQIVTCDERESGARALLNFGHTFGHVIETHMGYGNWLHGEAVAAGMVQAARLSQLMGLISQDDVARIKNVLQLYSLPIEPPAISVIDALNLMGHDKKVQNGNIRLVLLKAIGEAFVTATYDKALLEQVLAG